MSGNYPFNQRLLSREGREITLFRLKEGDILEAFVMEQI